MNENRFCHKCGIELPPNAPEGICPSCLMQAGMNAESNTFLMSGFVPPSPEELADRFPQMEILELIGKGGMGAVYKARQKDLDRLVAVKILPPEVGADPSFAERFMREARTLAKLNHPNIVSVFDVGQVDGQFHFIMEFVDGVTLRHLIETKSVLPSEALAIVPQICHALQFAHKEGIVHRDIKPENILVNRDGNIKIADFGLAKLLGTSEKQTGLTGTRQAMGTLHYMAPEQMKGAASVDNRADIYSLGVVFYEMLTGELPIGRFPPPSQKVELDVRLDEVVLRSLENDPEHRYQQVSEVSTDLGIIAKEEIATPAEKQQVPQSDSESSGLKLNRTPPSIIGLRWLLISINLVAAILAIALGGSRDYSWHARDDFERFVNPILARIWAHMTSPIFITTMAVSIILSVGIYIFITRLLRERSA